MDTEEVRGITLDIHLPGKPAKCIVFDGENPDVAFQGLFQWISENAQQYGVRYEELLTRTRAVR